MEFPPNSHKANEKGSKEATPKKSIEKVVQGEVTQRKKPLGRRFKEIFVGGEFKSAARYIATDVLLPAFRNMIVDATTKGIERMMYGDEAPRRRRGYSESRTSRVSYNAPVNRHLSERPAYRGDSRPRPKQDIGEIVLTTRDEAELVVERMTDIADKFDVVSVADLYELVGLPTTHVDNKWGWSGLHDVNVRQVREGYLIDLPLVEPL